MSDPTDAPSPAASGEPRTDGATERVLPVVSALSQKESAGVAAGPGAGAPARRGMIALLDDVRTALTSIVFVVAIGLLIVAILQELWDHTIVIEPIGVPPALSKIGFSPDVIAQRLMDEIMAIRKAAVSSATRAKQAPHIAPASVQLDVQVPGLGVSYRALIRLLRRIAGLKPDTHIAGEITGSSAHLTLRLRVPDHGEVLLEPEVAAGGSIDELLRVGAEAIERIDDPYVLATSLSDRGLTTAALKMFEYCTRTAPTYDDGWCYNRWGMLLAEQGDSAGATAKYEQAIAIDPTNAFPHNNLGWALFQHGDLPAALAKFEHAAALDPSNAYPICNWGRVLAKQGDRSGALAKFQAAIAVNAGWSEPYNCWGSLLLDEGDVDGAIEKFRRATEIEPQLASGFVHWARALRAKGDGPGAVGKYREAIAADPRACSPYDPLGRLLAEQGNRAQALETYERGVACDPKSAYLRADLGLALADAGQTARAVEQLTAAIALGHPSAVDLQKRVDRLTTVRPRRAAAPRRMAAAR